VIELKLPEEIIETVRQLADTQEQTQWALGDYLAEQLENTRVEYEYYGIKNYRAWFIRQLANHTGLDAGTLRDRQVMAEFFPLTTRAVYCPPLTYHQLRACKAAGDQWRQYANWAAADLVPAAVIRQRIRNNGHDTPAWIGRWERMRTIAEALLAGDTPEVVKTIARMVLDAEL
jgi:hypothetical protein